MTCSRRCRLVSLLFHWDLPKFLRFIWLAVLVYAYVALITEHINVYQTSVIMYPTSAQTEFSSEYNIDKRRDYLRLVSSLLHDVKHGRLSWMSELRWLRLIEQLDPYQLQNVTDLSADHVSHVTTNVTLNACPEVYTKGKNVKKYVWDSTYCKSVRPLHQVVTFILDLCHYRPPKPNASIDVIEEIIALYHRPSVLVFVCHETNVSAYESVGAKVFSTVIGRMGGKGAWLQLVTAIQTDYSLMLRDVTAVSPDDWRVERLVSVLANRRIAVAGGSSRNDSGHWRSGCWYEEMSMYTWRRVRGYLVSTEECMVCTSIDASFVVRSSTLRALTPDFSLLGSGIFWLDWFFLLQNQSYSAVLCPDSMFYAQYSHGDVEDRSSLRQLAAKWRINIVHLPTSDHPLSFSCSETNLTCQSDQYKNHVEPPCCVAPVCQLLRVIVRVCRSEELDLHLMSRRAAYSGLPDPEHLSLKLLAVFEVRQSLLKEGLHLQETNEANSYKVIDQNSKAAIIMYVHSNPELSDSSAGFVSICGESLPVYTGPLLENREEASPDLCIWPYHSCRTVLHEVSGSVVETSYHLYSPRAA